MPKFSRIHPSFRLNGIAAGREDLGEIAYSIIKEGEPHEKELGDFLLDWLSASPTITVATSGSTGQPTLHVLQKQRMMHSAVATGSYFGLEPGNSALLCLPIRFIAGKMMLVRAMVLGLSLDFVKPSSEPLEGIHHAYDFCAMVPAQFLGALDQMHFIRKLIIGGAPLGPKGIKAAQPLKTEVYETFGMTETISHIAARRINPTEATFHTLPRVKVGIDERSCLVVMAPDIAADPIVTNDLIKLVSTTSFEWLGRCDNIVNSGGIKLIPEQIENKLQQFMDARFFVCGLPDDSLGQRLVLIVEAHPDPPGILKKLRSLKALSAFEIPKEVLSANEFASTGSGKINRHETLKQLGLGKA